jgi:phosphoserine phosphatase
MHRIVLQGPALTSELARQAAALAGARSTDMKSGVATLSGFAAEPQQAPLRELCEHAQIDCAFVDAPLPLAHMRLAVMDMDSTLITIECIDEIADMQGLKLQVAAITESAMRGEIDFRQSLARRVALLKGLEEGALQRVYDERLRLTPGVQAMIAGFKAAGIKTLLVSGGFTFFADRVRARLGLDYAASNVLGIEDGKLTGLTLGPVIDADAKAQKLLETCQLLGCAPDQAIAIGDGANDLKMMGVAGVSIAYHAKPVVREQARFALTYNGLDAVLPLFD